MERLRALTSAELAGYTSCGSPSDLAAHLGVSVTAARTAVARAGLQVSISQANRLRYRKRVRIFTPDQQQLILGSLLGDACLARQTRKNHFVLRLCFAHGKKQLAYLEHKKSVIGGTRIGTRPEGSNIGDQVSQFAVCDTQALLPYERMCKVDGAKYVSDEWLGKLDWKGIAYWYQDDASLIRQNGKISCIRWYTNSFSLPEIGRIVRFVRSLGLSSVNTATGNGDPSQRVIVIYKRREIERFLAKIKQHIVPCLQYKLP